MKIKTINRGGAQGTTGTARPTGVRTSEGLADPMRKALGNLKHHEVNHKGGIRSGAAATTGTARGGGFQNPANINHGDRFKDVFEHFGKLPK